MRTTMIINAQTWFWLGSVTPGRKVAELPRHLLLASGKSALLPKPLFTTVHVMTLSPDVSFMLKPPLLPMKDYAIKLEHAGRVYPCSLRIITSCKGTYVIVSAPEGAAAEVLANRFEGLLPKLVKKHGIVMPFTPVQHIYDICPLVPGGFAEYFHVLRVKWDYRRHHPAAPGVGSFQEEGRHVMLRSGLETLIGQELLPFPFEK